MPCGCSGYPSGATLADVTSNESCDFTFSQSAGGAAALGYTLAYFTWTSMKSTGEPPYTITQGSQVAVGVAVRRESATVKMRAVVKVNLRSRFSEIILRAQDLSGTGSQTSYDLSTMSDDTWVELSHDETSASLWGTDIRLTVTAKGTTNPNNVGESVFYIEWIRVEL